MKNEVIEYVMNSPGNTNRAVLESLLDGINSGSSDYTGLSCYAFHRWTEETDNFLGEEMPMVKISDDVPYVVSGQKCITFDVTSGNPFQSEFVVQEDTPDGINIVRMVFVMDETSGMIIFCVVDETLSAMFGTPAGIWCNKQLAMLGSSSGGAYMIIA